MSAQSSQYGKGGFYCELGVGASNTTMKYKNDAPEQKGVLDVAKVAKKGKIFEAQDTSTGRVIGCFYHSQFSEDDSLDISKMHGIKKKNMLPHIDLTFGADIVKQRVRLGIEVSFGHNFGKTSKTEIGLNMNGKYININDKKTITLPGDISADVLKVDKTIMLPNAKLGLGESFNQEKYGIDSANDIKRIIDIYEQFVYDSELETKISKKNRFNISIMPKIGIICNPTLEFYGTAGIVVKSDRYKISFPNIRSKTDESIKKTVTKIVPRIGCGACINLGTSGTYMKLGYYYTFKSKGKKETEHLNMTNTFESSENLIRMSIGKRF